MNCPNCGSEKTGELGGSNYECLTCGKTFQLEIEQVYKLAEYKLDNAGEK